MEWTVELVVVPVTDIDRAKAFYIDRAGFEELVDVRVGEDTRVVQLTPHGSPCAIALMNDSPMTAGTLHGLHLVVPDIEQARAELAGRGVEVSDFFHFGPQGQRDGPDPERRNYNTYVSFPRGRPPSRRLLDHARGPGPRRSRGCALKGRRAPVPAAAR